MKVDLKKRRRIAPSFWAWCALVVLGFALASLPVVATNYVYPASSGGGAAALDAGSVNAGLIGDGAVAQGHLSGALQAAVVFKNDAGLIEGYITGTSAITSVCYGDGGLTDGSSCVTQTGKITAAPWSRAVGGFHIDYDPDAGSTYLAPAMPPFLSRGFAGNVTTTNATNTQCTDFNLPAHSTATAWITFTGTQNDGGLNGLSYIRTGMFRRTDGGIAVLSGGSYATIGTDREDSITGVLGPGVPTIDGGVVGVMVTGEAGSTISWECYVQLFQNPSIGAVW